MLNEDALIPFHSSDPTGKRVLVLAPHPDDETIGCGGTLVLHALAGDPVRVIFLTNGAKGDISGRFDRETYIRIRQQEARSACACLGITDIEFWPFEDRELYRTEFTVKMLMDQIATYRPELIYAPSPFEFHPDHRAASSLGQRVMANCNARTELMFYEVNQPVQVNRLVDITPVLDRKKQALRCYQSQLQERPYDDISLALSRFRSMTLPAETTHAEGFLLFAKDQYEQATPWSGERYADCQPETDLYALGVIVRTQGMRESLLIEALTSIATQPKTCLAVVVVHANADRLESIHVACQSIDSLAYVIIHADETDKRRGYPLNLGLQYCLWHHKRIDGVAFLDDDDILYSNFSERMLEALNRTGSDVIYAASNRCVPGHPPTEGYQPISILNLFVQNFIPINSYVIRRDSLIRKPVWVDETLAVTEDWHFLLKLIQNGYRFEAILDIVSEFRMVSDGNMPTKIEPEVWMHASKIIQEYVEKTIFQLNGNIIRDVMLSALYRDADHAAVTESLQKKIHELEMVLPSSNRSGLYKWLKRMEPPFMKRIK